MRLPSFEYLEPETLEEALSLLELHQGRCKIIAGGTDLLVAMKRRLKTPENLISLAKIPLLAGISQENGSVVIGSLTTLDEVANSPLIKGKLPGLAKAAWEVGSPLLRTAATIGGNLCVDTRCRFYNQSMFWRSTRGPCCKTGGDTCHVTGRENTCFSSFSGDVAPMLIALNATIRLAGQKGQRIVPLQEFYTGDGRHPNLLSDGAAEIITSVQVTVPPAHVNSTYKKFRFRQSVDFPVVGVAVRLDRDGTSCRDLKIVLTNVGSRPVEAVNARQQLLGQVLSPATVTTAAEAAASEVHLVRTGQVTPYYKRKLVKILVAEVIEEIGG